MAKQLLDRPNVGALLQQMRGKGMTEDVTGCWLSDPGRVDGCTYRPLSEAGIEMMPALPVGVNLHGANISEASR